MKISVVTVCHNSEHTIVGAVRSFLAQTYDNKELLVIDGQSTDRTVQIVREFASPDIRIISEADNGIYDAMNKGLRHFSGDAVGFLNSDDTFHDDRAMERIAEALEYAEAAQGGVAMVKDHETKQVMRRWKTEPFRPGAFRRGWMPPHPAFYVRRSLVERTGEFDLSYSIASDYDFMLRALELSNAAAAEIPGMLVDFKLGGKSSGNLSKVVRGNLECLKSRRQHLGAPVIDQAFFLKLMRKTMQLRWEPENAYSMTELTQDLPDTRRH